LMFIVRLKPKKSHSLIFFDRVTYIRIPNQISKEIIKQNE